MTKLGRVSLILFGLGVLVACQEPTQISSDSLRAPSVIGEQECGEASYYGVGDGFAGRRTANGSIMRPEETNKAACGRNLLNKWITLECGGRSFDVQCVDRGAFRADEGGRAYGRVLDLYAGTFQQCFGSLGRGKGQVCYRLGKKSQQEGQYCGIDFETGKPHFQAQIQESGSVYVSVDQRCPGTSIDLVLIEVSSQGGKSKVIAESKAFSFPVESRDGRKSVTIAAEKIESIASKNFTHMRFIVSKGEATLFSTGPDIPSPAIPGRSISGGSTGEFSQVFADSNHEGFIDAFSYDGIDLRAGDGTSFEVNQDYWPSSPQNSSQSSETH